MYIFLNQIRLNSHRQRAFPTLWLSHFSWKHNLVNLYSRSNQVTFFLVTYIAYVIFAQSRFKSVLNLIRVMTQWISLRCDSFVLYSLAITIATKFFTGWLTIIVQSNRGEENGGYRVGDTWDMVRRDGKFLSGLKLSEQERFSCNSWEKRSQLPS